MSLPNFTFAIPLRSAQASVDWARVSAQFQHTASSALSSIDADVRIIVACHEIPDVEVASDSRVSFVQVDHVTPTSLSLQMFDKSVKKMKLAEEHYRQGGGYMMLLDSDDLVSNRLASYVLTDDNRSGYFLQHGYILDLRRSSVERVDNFDAICGSSSIFYLDPADQDTMRFNWPLYITVMRHQDFGPFSEASPRPMASVPFPAAIAVKNNGENHSFRENPGLARSIQRRIRKFINRTEIPNSSLPDVAEEFSCATLLS
ncbi:hypothetical protein [Sphingomonas lenta]|uniref:hypothetical protein n=1 Tax=Sphingomonas lenta TaxID=1141887 RepID=UPI001141048C|nr:hypothetical protein [Sphingomonas lenta]